MHVRARTPDRVAAEKLPLGGRLVCLIVNRRELVLMNKKTVQF